MNSLKSILIFELKFIRRLLIEFVFLTSVLIYSFSLFLETMYFYLLSLSMVQMLSVALTAAVIVYLRTEREKSGILSVYKRLPMNSLNIYCSFLLTPLVLFFTLNYLPGLGFTIIFRDTLSAAIRAEGLGFFRFFTLIHLVLPAFLVFLFILTVNLMLFTGERAKRFLVNGLMVVLFSAVFSRYFSFTKRLSISWESVKLFLFRDLSGFYISLILLILSSLIFIMIFTGIKRIDTRVHGEL